MFRAMCSIAVFAVLVASLPLQAEPICLGQDWNTGWLYTTLDGAETGACQLCMGEWEEVPEWVAGFEMICQQDGWEIITCNNAQTLCLVRPRYDWAVCQQQILRCPTVIGC